MINLKRYLNVINKWDTTWISCCFLLFGLSVSCEPFSLFHHSMTSLTCYSTDFEFFNLAAILVICKLNAIFSACQHCFLDLAYKNTLNSDLKPLSSQNACTSIKTNILILFLATIRCYIPNIKALCQAVSDKKSFIIFPI